MSHLSDRDLAMTDRWIAECRRILAEARARRDGAQPRTNPHPPPPADVTDVRPTRRQPAAAPPPEAWTPASVLDDIPLPDEPPEEDWRR